MNKNTFAKALLFLIMLLVASTSWAAGPFKKRFTDNTKVGINLGVGFPYVWGLEDPEYKKYKIRYRSPIQESHQIHGLPNLSLGVMLGYSFPLANALRIGPEIGCNYGFTRCEYVGTRTTTINPFKRTRETLANFSLKEHHIQIPIAAKVDAFDKEISSSRGLTLGYEIDIAFYTQYKENKKAVSDSTQPLGSVFLGGTLDLLGFYLVSKLKFSLEALTGVPSHQCLKRSRMLSSSMIEITVGVDIMKWL